MLVNSSYCVYVIASYFPEIVTFGSVDTLSLIRPCIAPGDRRVSPSLRTLRVGLLLSQRRGSGGDSTPSGRRWTGVLQANRLTCRTVIGKWMTGQSGSIKLYHLLPFFKDD